MADIQVELKNENEQEIETENVMHPAVFQQNQNRKRKGEGTYFSSNSMRFNNSSSEPPRS